jgi:hypothetical protein
MKSLKEIISLTVAGSPSLKKGVLGSSILPSVQKKLNELFPNNNGVAKAMYIKNDVLVISCKNSAVAQEIKLSEKNILQNIQVKKMRCVLSEDE